MRHPGERSGRLLVRGDPRYRLEQPAITVPRIVTLRQRQLFDRCSRLLGIGSRSRHPRTAQDLGDVAILAENYTCNLFGECVLIIDGPRPAVAEFAMIYWNEFESHGHAEPLPELVGEQPSHD